MKLETFFEKFDQFADAPDAVAKMRGLILRLAMQGKLSEPHKADSPVSELLREVEKDKIRYGHKSSVIATNGDADFSDDETADAIPARWTWVRFGNIARHNAGKTLDKGRNRGELRDYITTSNLYWGFFQLDAVRQMPMLEDEIERCTAIKGDLLICEGGEAGRGAVWPHDREISFQNHVHRARFFAGINPYFIQRYLEKLNATGEIEKYRKGVGISNMSGKALASIPIPLPPLAEQKRIVAKVDELMALCDRLEAQQQERETRHAALARASLARFADAPTPANLSYLFHSSFIIHPSDLRKSILTLAVQGKLVPQDPNDEPAEECLKRIGIKNTLTPDESDDTLPSSWSRVRFEDIALTAGGVTLGRKLGDRKTVTLPYLRVANVKRGEIDLGIIKDMTIGEDEIERYALRENDLLMTEGGDWDKVGRAAIWKGQIKICLHQNHVFRSRMRSAEISPVWFERYFNSPEGRRYFESASKQTTNLASINMRQVRGSPVPLPPLAEQRRIVDKVEQLMALVDALETQLATSRATAANLLTALVAELTQPS
jgi:type I restriction enzyme, S subunit